MWSTAPSPPTSPAAVRSRRFEAKRAEQKSLGKQVAQAQGDEKAELLARTKALSAEVKELEAAQAAAEAEWDEALKSIPNPAADEAPAGGEDDFVTLEHVGTPREFDFEPRDHIELGRMLGAIDLERGAKVSGSRFYFLTGIGAQLELALVNMAMDQARNAGFTQVIAPSLVKPRAMEGTGFLGQAADDVYRIEGEDLYLVGTSEVPMAAYHSDEILEASSLPLRYAAFSPCFRKEAGSHGKDTKGIIRVHWFDKVEMFVLTTARGVLRRAPAAARLGEGVPRQARARLPRHRRRRRRPRPERAAQVRLRGVDPHPGQVPRADLDLQLHRLPEPPPRHPPARSQRQLPGRHPQRHADRDHPDHRRDPGDAPAGGRIGARARSPAALPRWPRGPDPDRRSLSMTGPGNRAWSALDIDGTLLAWVEGAGQTYERVTPAVYAAVHRAIDAGAHIVLSSGRSPHGMDKIADLLDLPAAVEDRIWVVASNGAVIFRYPPLEVVHEETFDAREAVAAVLQHHPNALVAVEERGIGYRVNRHFPHR